MLEHFENDYQYSYYNGIDKKCNQHLICIPSVSDASKIHVKKNADICRLYTLEIEQW